MTNPLALVGKWLAVVAVRDLGRVSRRITGQGRSGTAVAVGVRCRWHG